MGFLQVRAFFVHRDGYYEGLNTTVSRYAKYKNACTRERVRAHATQSLP